MGSVVLDHDIKVRKPYTITKQRERWTEEEHNKFLEALKLYGRAWRQIEEHIASKTAVQIRSHAQKFFTKAVRESNTIEIPPPRPKKRPMRPYPRKHGNLPGNAAMEKFPESEQDDQSPTSVLSSASDQMNSCTSPVSSVAGASPVGTLPCGQENGCHSTTTAADEEDESVPQHTSDMELDLGMDDSIPSKTASFAKAQPASLRLFGKMLVVAEPQRPSSFSTENAEPAVTIGAPKPSRLNTVDAEPAVTTDVSQELSVTDSVSTVPSQWNPWASSMAPVFYFLPSRGNLANSAEAGVAPTPWFWAAYGENQSSVRECSDDESVQRESSSGGGSNSVEFTIENAGARVFNDHGFNDGGGMPVKLRRSGTSAFRSLKATPKKDTKGFVPYRRCMAEREIKLISNNAEGSQGVHLRF